LINSKRFLGSHYFIYFGTLGISLPFFNLFCHHLGFSGFQIGLISSVKTLGVIFFPMLWAIAADRFHARKKILVLCTTLGAASWAFLLFTTQFANILFIIFVHSIFFSPVIAFIEAFAMEILNKEKKKYGLFRVWGSLSFIFVAAVLGKLLNFTPVGIIIPLILCGLCVQIYLSIKMPESLQAKRNDFSVSAFRQFFSPKTSLFLFIAFLMLASHGAYYGFFSIHLESLGFDTGFIGMSWALASLAEIVIMIRSDKLFSRFTIKNVLFFSFAAAAVRWMILFYSTSPAVILGSQILHAFSYGSFHVASILGIEMVSSEEVRTLGQAANNSVTYGAGMMAGFLFSGLFFDSWHEYLFLASAGVAAIGGVLILFLDLKQP